ncbi:MAG: hypothetical protein CL868_06600 [Cytophagaceae bacterium]|nr:hypothetical protein [Cytophagaceae bacterium]|tara:strand:- start:8125 stop:8613 length:489 start_codon:yes stop_codon:yes gene_type:complete
MKVWSRLKTMNLSQLLKLAKVFIQRPQYINLTLKASRKAMTIASREYGKKHYGNNPANAFRHALWVTLIAQGVYRKKKDLAAAKNWAKKVTDLHEDIAVNKPLERAMDLHNNKIGLLYFDAIFDKNEQETVDFLKKITEKAQKIKKPEDTKNHPKEFVFIDD